MCIEKLWLLHGCLLEWFGACTSGADCMETIALGLMKSFYKKQETPNSGKWKEVKEIGPKIKVSYQL